jgi:callose synthase
LIILPATYSRSIKNPTGLLKTFSIFIGNFKSQSIYNCAVALYMFPSIFNALFCIFPPVRRALQSSNSRIVRFFLWWMQV